MQIFYSPSPSVSEGQKIQEFDKKPAASNIKADKLDTHPRQAYTISKKLYSFWTGLVLY